jgi:hypothetical protein
MRTGEDIDGNRDRWREIELWHRAMDEWKRSVEELVTTETKEGERRHRVEVWNTGSPRESSCLNESEKGNCMGRARQERGVPGDHQRSMCRERAGPENVAHAEGCIEHKTSAEGTPEN